MSKWLTVALQYFAFHTQPSQALMRKAPCAVVVIAPGFDLIEGSGSGTCAHKAATLPLSSHTSVHMLMEAHATFTQDSHFFVHYFILRNRFLEFLR